MQRIFKALAIIVFLIISGCSNSMNENNEKPTEIRVHSLRPSHLTHLLNNRLGRLIEFYGVGYFGRKRNTDKDIAIWRSTTFCL